MRVPPYIGLSVAFLMSPIVGMCDNIHIGAVYSTDKKVELQLEFVDARVLPDQRNVWLLENGVATVRASELKPARVAGRPLAAIIAVDVSGSMRGDPIAKTREAIAAHLSGFTAQDSVALVSFASDSRLEAEFGPPQRQELSDTARGLVTRGNRTAVYDSLLYCLDLLQRAPAQRRRLIVLSDGWDETSRAKMQDVLDRARRERVAIDAIGVGKVAEEYANSLYRLASETKGQYVYTSSHDVGKQLELIVQRLEEMPVAIFERNLDPARTVQKVAVEVVSAGSAADISEELAMSIPATLIQTEGRAFPWGLVIAALAILVVIAVVILIGRKKKKSPQKEAVPIPEPSPEPEPEPNPRRRRGVTMVDHGSYPPPASPANSANGPVLKVLNGTLKGKKISISSTVLRIGAAHDNDLAVTDDEAVSGHHAVVRVQGPDAILDDANSRNGTFVNGKRIDASYVLLTGDIIRIGQTEIVVGDLIR